MQLSPQVEKSADDIRSLLAKGYPRQSRIDLANDIALQALSRFVRAPEAEWCEGIEEVPFQWVVDVAGWQESDLEQLRQSYMARQLKLYYEFLHRLKVSPLPSVLVGCAGYLINSGLARASDILMLVFANKAAAEMQARIDNRLGRCGLAASTFHTLGKDIIAKVEGQQQSLTPFAEDDKRLALHVNQWFV